MNERPPAVAGTFYPGDAPTLSLTIERFLRDVATSPAAAAPKALIVPHAGYSYSGAVAASAYALLTPAAGAIRRVVLLGPAHTVPLSGLAAPSVEAFRTPLGAIPIDREVIDELLGLPSVAIDDAAHAREHSLEVHLPFLQEVLESFTLVPLVVGDATTDEVVSVLERTWNGERTLVVVSSDLTHFHDYATATRLDRRTAEAIAHLDPGGIGAGDACGRIPIRALLRSARRHDLRSRVLDLRNSGDTAGPRDRVVGYGAFSFSRSG